jgi:hypothetical protein
MEAKTSITLETEELTVTVSTPQTELPLPELLDDVIVPALRTLGFTQTTINKFIDIEGRADD